MAVAYSRTAIATAATEARFSSYETMREAVDAELVKVSTAVGSLSTVCDGKMPIMGTIQALTTPGANVIASTSQHITLDNTETAIAATISTMVPHQGIMVIEAISEPDTGQDHTVVITTGTFDGTHKTATFADVSDRLIVLVDVAGKGHVLVNTGSVALS